jgi:hypothetical protein
MQPQMQTDTRGANPTMGLLSIFYSPVEAYTGSGKHGWIIALAAACLVAVLGNWFIIDKVGYGTIVRNQIESNSSMAEQLGPEGIDKIVRDAENSTFQKGLAYAGAPIGILVMSFLFAGLAYGFLLVLGGQTTYHQILTTGAWATYALMVVMMAGSAATVALMTDFSGVDMSRIFGLNAGIFLADARPVVRALASGFDLIAFWAIFLQVTGATRLSQRVTTGQALTVYLTLHVLFTMLRAGWAAMFG